MLPQPSQLGSGHARRQSDTAQQAAWSGRGMARPVCIPASSAPRRSGRASGGNDMIKQLLKSRRAALWALFIVVASICFALANSGRVRRHKAGQTAEILRPLLAADSRFKNIQVSCGTNGRVYLRGVVASKEDLFALRDLIVQAHLPSQPVFAVRFPIELPNPRSAGDGGSPVQFQIGSARPAAPDHGR